MSLARWPWVCGIRGERRSDLRYLLPNHLRHPGLDPGLGFSLRPFVSTQPRRRQPNPGSSPGRRRRGGGVVSWFKRKPKPPKPEELEKIIQAYGALLASKKPFGSGGSYAVADLPFEKIIIKSALLGAQAQPDLSEEEMCALFVGFTELGRFQPNGGSLSPIWSNRSEEFQTSEIERMRLTNDEKAMASTVNAEMDALRAEWEEVRGMWVQLHSLAKAGTKTNA
jgi:hypothetical protein